MVMFIFIITQILFLAVFKPMQWRNVAPVAPASPGGAMRRGRQNFELKLFGCKNVPYVITSAKLTFGGGGKIFGGTKSSRGRQKASGGAKKL